MDLNGATNNLYPKIAQKLKLKLFFSIRSIRLSTVLHPIKRRGCISPRGSYIRSDMGPGTGAHIARDMRTQGPISLGIWGRGGGANDGRPILLLHQRT